MMHSSLSILSLSIIHQSIKNLVDVWGRWELSTYGTGNGKGGVDISVVRRWVCLKHGNGETNTGVLVKTLWVQWVGGVGDEASHERSLEASDGDALVGALDWDWVGEGNAWWARLTSSRLVKVGRGGGWGLVVSLEADDLDVVADQVEVGVEAEVVVSNGAWKTAGEGIGQRSVVLDDLLRGGDDGELGGVLDGEVGLLGAVLLRAVLWCLVDRGVLLWCLVDWSVLFWCLVNRSVLLWLLNLAVSDLLDGLLVLVLGSLNSLGWVGCWGFLAVGGSSRCSNGNRREEGKGSDGELHYELM